MDEQGFLVKEKQPLHGNEENESGHGHKSGNHEHKNAMKKGRSWLRLVP